MKTIKILTVAVLIITMFAVIPVAAKDNDSVSVPLSPALQTIADGFGMSKWYILGNELTFSADDFLKAQNLSEIDYITVSTLPSPELGELTLGGEDVVAGQHIPASALNALRFVPSESSEPTISSFELSFNGAPYSITCTLYALKEPNRAPSLADSGAATTNLATYTGISCSGVLRGSDPDNDELRYEVIEYPSDGFVELDSAQLRYTPIGNFSGKDSFKCVALDKYGDFSAPITVTVNVEQRRTSIEYLDLDGHDDESCAIAMTEAGIMSGSCIGNGYYFYPDEAVSRAEFIVMAMNAAGITELADVADTGFYDDAEIPAAMKGYVSAAHKLDYVHGQIDENGMLCFNPKDPITRADAAFVLCRVLGAKAQILRDDVFSDAVPSWAETEILTLEQLGLLLPVSGNTLAAYAPLTRAQCARMLSSAMRISE